MDRLELWYKDMVRPDPAPEARGSSIVEGDTFFKDLLRYPLARKGVYAPRWAYLPSSYQAKNNQYCGPMALRIAFFRGYE